MKAPMLLAALLAAAAAVSTAGAAAVPTLTVKTVAGPTFKLAGQRGHWVVINYWATWCAPCRDELPTLSAFARAHPAVRILGLTYEKISATALLQFLTAHPLSYPAARVDQHALPRELKPIWFGMHALPLTYLVAPDGRVAKELVGELDPAKLQAVIAAGGRRP